MCENHDHASPEQKPEPAHAQDHHGDGHDHGHHHGGGGNHHAHAQDAASTGDDLAECPVMPGSFAEKTQAEAAGLVRDYEGTRYYLCCAACGLLFDADPKKYVSAI